MNSRNIAALIAVPLVLSFCGGNTDRYLCEHRKKLYYLELTSNQATVKTWEELEIASEKIQRLGEHRFRGPNGWRGNPGVMGIDMVAAYSSGPGDRSAIEFSDGCRLIGSVQD